MYVCIFMPVCGAGGGFLALRNMSQVSLTWDRGIFGKRFNVQPQRGLRGWNGGRAYWTGLGILSPGPSAVPETSGLQRAPSFPRRMQAQASQETAPGTIWIPSHLPPAGWSLCLAQGTSTAQGVTCDTEGESQCPACPSWEAGQTREEVFFGVSPQFVQNEKKALAMGALATPTNCLGAAC